MIIGLTGTKASGKGEIAKFLQAKGFLYFSLSDIVREEAKKKGLGKTVAELQDVGNWLREKYGPSVLAKRIIKVIKEVEREKGEKGSKNFVIDGIRNPAEIKELRKLRGFYLISVDAPKKKRFEWMLKRARPSDPKTWSEFLKMDKRDKGKKELVIGQQVKACMQMADFKIKNNSTLLKLREKIERILEVITRKQKRFKSTIPY